MVIETNATKLKQVRPIQIGRNLKKPANEIILKEETIKLFKNKAKYAEPTGKGDLLIIEGYFGRMFRSAEKSVRKELREYCDQYKELCRRFDEDPAKQYYEVLAWNELYNRHTITPSVAGDEWGYRNSDDYRVELDFYIQLHTSGPWVERLGEAYLYYEPYEWCPPFPCNLEEL